MSINGEFSRHQLADITFQKQTKMIAYQIVIIRVLISYHLIYDVIIASIMSFGLSEELSLP